MEVRGRSGSGHKTHRLNALELGQPGVGAFDRRRNLTSGPAASQYGARLRAGGSLHGDNRAGSDLRLLLDGRFNVLWMDVEPRRGDDHLALAPQKAQLARFLPLCNVTGCQPFVLARAEFAALPGGAGDHGAAHEHLAVGASLTSRPASGLPMVPLAT